MITIRGAGLAGLTTALVLLRRGAAVTLYDRAERIGAASVARFAGGMLAPWCEAESAEPEVLDLGREALDFWGEVTPVTQRGTLVLAAGRDRADLTQFARRSTGHETLDETRVAALEPALAGRFRHGLFFAQEAHLDPRRALLDLAAQVTGLGGTLCLGETGPERVDLDCTGMAAPLPRLRPVRGEMAILRCPDVEISRTLRLLHPRAPLYLVPRGAGLYMIGATSVESSSTRPPSLRSLADLLGAAYAVHPGFAEASVEEIGAGLRPAFADNLPQLIHRDGTLYLNGLYRHGFLLAPAMARRAARNLLGDTEDETDRQRLPA
ncbi:MULTISPECIES: FAD-dependent oxidoreductase [Roseovarius]|uniref:D-amino acid oxidase family protein n=1 Tax=Roseovarius nubinhibens (strain ATCC BAA-591 / DSM 15170 / ISM) TaxID=89187 RepID=A3SR13_ROSNI|nr:MULTISPECIES: FAD-dependent oxidoreductase [Roseovarius]EAP75572.1 D-amino acid oxidase family protein [Roseovarius nubinhibens ISM]MAZ23025.1 FAD-dependent oxidoreductase [Roseovarius sp.]